MPTLVLGTDNKSWGGDGGILEGILKQVKVMLRPTDEEDVSQVKTGGNSKDKSSEWEGA